MIDLVNIQKQLSLRFGMKIDVYHSEKHMGILAVPNGMALSPFVGIATGIGLMRIYEWIESR